MSNNQALSRLERVYLANQSDISTIASVGNSDCMRHIKVDMHNEVASLIRRDKTGARTATVGVRGRGFGVWNLEASLAPSGVAGTVPDFDPLLISVFGQASSASGGGRLYTFGGDVDQYFSLYSFRTPSTLNQRVSMGCLANEFNFEIGADIAEFTCNGESVFVLESDFFADATTYERGGLSSFPSEPGSPVTNGGIIAGFTGEIKIGGDTIGRIRRLRLRCNNQSALIKDTFGRYEPNDSLGDVRLITVSFDMYESDEDSQKAIRNATISKEPIDIDATVGTVSGSIVQALVKNVQLASYTLDDSTPRYSLTVPDSRAYGTDTTAQDELQLLFK